MKRTTADVDGIHFQNPRLSRVGVEVLTLAELRSRAAATLTAPQRVDFHLLLLVEAGRGKHVVDFVEYGLRPGSVVFVRTSQVQQWRMRESLQGQLVLIADNALAPSVARAAIDAKLLALNEWPAVTSVSHDIFRAARADVSRMRADVERFDGSEVEAAIIWHALLALLLRLARELRATGVGADASKQTEIYRLFARELEANFQKRLSVLDYAKRIGYSESTLSRSCVATVGHTAKDAIDRRVALEAKRLLVHTHAPVAHIGHQLGFTEPTNFVKFFRRMAGRTPLAFRADTARP